MTSRSKPRTRPATTRTRAHSRARVARLDLPGPWTYRAALPCDELDGRPCHALVSPRIIIWIGPFDPRTTHLYRAIAARMLQELDPLSPLDPADPRLDARNARAQAAAARLDQARAQVAQAPPTARATAGSREQSARSSTPLHTPAHKDSSRHR